MIMSYVNYLHTQALPVGLLLTTGADADAGLQATFSCVFLDFSPYEQYIFVHDKSSLCFHGFTDLSLHKQRKKTGILSDVSMRT